MSADRFGDLEQLVKRGKAAQQAVDALLPATRIRVVLELEPSHAAALLRFADKSGHREAMEVLYPHLPRDLRSDQASQICCALIALQRALLAAGVLTSPWIETGAE